MALVLTPDHRYLADGKPVPGTTSIIEDVLGPAVDESDPRIIRAGQRGTAVHVACQLDDEGALDEETVHPVVLPYLEAWRAYRRDTGWATDAAEVSLLNTAYWYAGTIDRIGRERGNVSTVLDIKTSATPSPRWRLQVAAYTGLRADLVLFQRIVVQLLPTGRYRRIPYTDRADWQDWLAILRVHRIKGAA